MTDPYLPPWVGPNFRCVVDCVSLRMDKRVLWLAVHDGAGSHSTSVSLEGVDVLIAALQKVKIELEGK